MATAVEYRQNSSSIDGVPTTLLAVSNVISIKPALALAAADKLIAEILASPLSVALEPLLSVVVKPIVSPTTNGNRSTRSAPSRLLSSAI